MRVLVITTKGEYIEREIEDKLEVLQDIVGGYIEYVDLSQDGLSMIINEEGKILDLEYNLGATILFNETHLGRDFICGNAIIVRDVNGENASISDEDIKLVKDMIVNGIYGGVK